MKLAALVALLSIGYGCATAPPAPVPIVEETAEQRREKSFLLAASHIETEILKSTDEYEAEFTLTRNDGTTTNGYWALRRESTRHGQAVRFLLEYSREDALIERHRYVYLSKVPYYLLQATIDRKDEHRNARYENGRWTLKVVERRVRTTEIQLTDEMVNEMQRDFMDDVIHLVSAHIKQKSIYAEAAHERRVL